MTYGSKLWYHNLINFVPFFGALCIDSFEDADFRTPNVRTPYVGLCSMRHIHSVRL